MEEKRGEGRVKVKRARYIKKKERENGITRGAEGKDIGIKEIDK